jgi:hypothetical protein
MFIYFRAFYQQINHSKNDWLKIIGLAGIPLALLFVLASAKNYILSLWPSVELQTGAGYQQKPAEKRRKLGLILTLIILPLLLTFIYDLIK